MNTATLTIGDHVQVNVKGVTFTATVRSLDRWLIGIEPHHPKRYTWRAVSPQCIVKKLDRQGEAA